MAAIGRTQLHKLPQFAEHRRAVANRYLQALRDLEDLHPLRLPYDEIVPHIFIVRVLRGRRDGLMAHLRAAGIECGIHYKPNHLLSRFRTAYPLPVAERLGAELLTLPMHALLAIEDQEIVVREIRAYLLGGTDA
jgi:dTDP-4-amino-4,6-dideoxygalactose transaminase